MIQIPYFAQIILRNQKELPIKIKSITLGDPYFGNPAGMDDVPVSTYIHQNNHILGISQDILDIFSDADKNCGFPEVLSQLTYPPHGKIIIPGNPDNNSYALAQDKTQELYSCSQLETPVTPAEVTQAIYGGCYGPCATYTTAMNYLITRSSW